jgi:hypothetical protein
MNELCFIDSDLNPFVVRGSWDFYYLEPPRPLRKEGHTKSDMLEFAVKVFESTNEGTLMGNGGTLGLYKLMFPTATAPTEEIKEGTNWEKAFKTVLAKYEDTLKKYSDPQPEPSFTREEVSKGNSR